tara:strand:- start:207 stop:524 length:318 start_codon:yes stop_codon:yes gene_type:complete
MVNNKKKETKKKDREERKKKLEIQYCTKEQRQERVKEILNKLSEFQLNIKYEPVRKLYELFKKYIDDAERIEINIPFPDINRRIKGLLAISLKEETWINLKNEKF